MRKRNYTVTIRMNKEEYSQSASGSYYKYQSDCKKTAYRWRNPKRQYVVFPQQKYSQVSEGE